MRVCVHCQNQSSFITERGVHKCKGMLLCNRRVACLSKYLPSQGGASISNNRLNISHGRHVTSGSGLVKSGERFFHLNGTRVTIRLTLRMFSSSVELSSLGSVCTSDFFERQIVNGRNKNHVKIQRTERRVRWRCSTHNIPSAAAAAADSGNEQERLVIVGGGAAGVYGALRAKNLCPHLEVVVLEKGQLLSKVRISGGGRCNVTTGLFWDPKALAGQYPRGHKELRGSYFLSHGPADTVAWFTQRGVALKTENDGRMFPKTNSSATIVDCLLQEAKRIDVVLQTKSQAKKVSRKGQKFEICTGVDSRDQVVVSANYVLLATGSASQGFKIARGLGHSIIEPVPSLFTFKVMDKALTELAGVSFQRVKIELELPDQQQRYSEFIQDGPMLITHWGLSGPVVLRLSAWAARQLFAAKYTCVVWVDFTPSVELEALKTLLLKHKQESQKSNMGSYSPEKLALVKRFWIYLLERQGLDKDMKWARVSTKAIHQLALFLKRCPFTVCGKGEFKDEFVTAGGVPLAEVNLRTMESRICPGLFFAGEILDVDGVTGGFNFQNAWTGGYIAGTTVAERCLKKEVVSL